MTTGRINQVAILKGVPNRDSTLLRAPPPLEIYMSFNNIKLHTFHH